MNEPTGRPEGVRRKSRSRPSILSSRTRLSKEAAVRRTPHRETLIEGSGLRYTCSFYLFSSLHFLSFSLFLSYFCFYFPVPNISTDTTYFVSFIVPGSAHGYLSAARYRIHSGRRLCRRDCLFEIPTRPSPLVHN